jgi:hypothetical protein
VIASNPHGLGLAWTEAGAVHWLKSDDVEEIHEMAGLIPGTVVIHARLASVGGVRPELRHPFPVTAECSIAATGSAPAVLFQNGTWIEWREQLDAAEAEGLELPDGAMSDARAAAWLIHVRQSRHWLHRNSSRWVYLEAGAEPETIGQFLEFRGCLYSNMYWLKDSPSSSRKAVPRPSPRPVAKMGTIASPERIVRRRAASTGSEPRQLPDRMPAVPWFTLSDEMKKTADRVRGSAS